MTDRPAALDPTREHPDGGPRWVPLAAWLIDNRRAGEAVVARTLWPPRRANVQHATLEDMIIDVERIARLLGGVAREVERRADEAPSDG